MLCWHRGQGKGNERNREGTVGIDREGEGTGGIVDREGEGEGTWNREQGNGRGESTEREGEWERGIELI